MKFKPNSSNQKLYLKIFMPLILCIVTTMLVVSTVLYINFEKVASNQIYQDSSISKLLYFKEPEVFDLSLAISQLKNCRLPVPYID